VTSSWTAEAAIPGAQASSAPAIASYRDPAGQQALLATWRGTTGNLVDYAQGIAEADGTISWTAISALPRSEATTTAAPALLMPASPSLAIIAYRDPHGHIRSVVGKPAGRGFRWADSEQVATADVSRSGPALAVMPTGADATTSSPLVTVVWTDDGGAVIINKGLLIDKCPGCPGPDPQWGQSETLANSEHLGNPAVSAVGADLLLTYQSTLANQVMYQTSSGGTWSGPSVVPNAATITGPALLSSLMATVGSAGSISLYDYS
jgi:hypothetical protein